MLTILVIDYTIKKAKILRETPTTVNDVTHYVFRATDSFPSFKQEVKNEKNRKKRWLYLEDMERVLSDNEALAKI